MLTVKQGEYFQIISDAVLVAAAEITSQESQMYYLLNTDVSQESIQV